MAAIIIIFVFFFLVCKAVKAAARNDKPQQRGTPERGADPSAGKLASLDALQQQRDCIEKQIELIEKQQHVLNMMFQKLSSEINNLTAKEQIEKLPNLYKINSERQKIENKRISAYGKLATVENKIAKLIG